MGRLQEELENRVRYLVKIEAIAEDVDSLVTGEEWSFERAASTLDVPEIYMDDLREAYDDLQR